MFSPMTDETLWPTLTPAEREQCHEFLEVWEERPQLNATDLTNNPRLLPILIESIAALRNVSWMDRFADPEFRKANPNHLAYNPPKKFLVVALVLILALVGGCGKKATEDTPAAPDTRTEQQKADDARARKIEEGKREVMEKYNRMNDAEKAAFKQNFENKMNSALEKFEQAQKEREAKNK